MLLLPLRPILMAETNHDERRGQWMLWISRYSASAAWKCCARRRTGTSEAGGRAEEPARSRSSPAFWRSSDKRSPRASKETENAVFTQSVAHVRPFRRQVRCVGVG